MDSSKSVCISLYGSAPALSSALMPGKNPFGPWLIAVIKGVHPQS
jgi:hypothetical protein